MINLPYGSLSLLKDHIVMMDSFPFIYLVLTRVQYFLFSLAPVSFLIASTNSSLSGLLVTSFKLKVSYLASILEARGLVEFGRLSIGYLDIYS